MHHSLFWNWTKWNGRPEEAPEAFRYHRRRFRNHRCRSGRERKRFHPWHRLEEVRAQARNPPLTSRRRRVRQEERRWTQRISTETGQVASEKKPEQEDRNRTALEWEKTAYFWRRKSDVPPDVPRAAKISPVNSGKTTEEQSNVSPGLFPVLSGISVYRNEITLP